MLCDDGTLYGQGFIQTGFHTAGFMLERSFVRLEILRTKICWVEVTWDQISVGSTGSVPPRFVLQGYLAAKEVCPQEKYVRRYVF